MSIASVFRPLALAVLMLAGTTVAAFPQADNDAVDPPGRVGRLGYVEGTVSFRNADEDQWVPATLNYPVTTGDAFWTQPNSRAEIQIGSTDLRLDQATAVQIVQLDDAATQIQVDQGSVNLRVREMPPGGVRVITPRAAIEVTQPGRYHLDVAAAQGSEPGNEVRIAVLEGAARVDGLASPLTVTTGHSATLRAGEAYPMLAQAIAQPLDTWALERERLLAPKVTQQYVSPEMTGAQDLDTYGQWNTDPSYGAVWYPQAVPADWAPYRFGHWAFVAPWGWTWIDDQPWGFAPFHFGRWVRVRDRWGWCPGVRVHRPVFAPALVVFAASGPTSILIAAGRRPPLVGWVPLGPREVFRPGFRHSPRFFRDVNITNVNVTNITVINKTGDRDIRGFNNRPGFTAIPAPAFTGAMAANRSRVLVRDAEWTDARRVESLGDFKPSRSARAGVLVPAVVATPTEPRQRTRRGDRDESFAPSANTRPMVTPARDPDVVPRAPGPDRWQRATVNPERKRPAGSPANVPRDREPAVSPFQRGNAATPALRAPDSPTAAPPALRTPEPPGRTPSVPPVVPPGRTPNAATGNPPNNPLNNPPGRVPNVSRDGRDNRDPTNSRSDDGRRAPRFVAPQQSPQPTAPSQTPGSAPNTMAPQRPTSLQPVPSINQPERRDSGRSDTDRHREPPRTTNPTTQPRTITPPPPSPSLQRAPRPEQQIQPQRFTPPPQMRQPEREVRREPAMRHDSAPNRSMTMPQPAIRPAPQPQRQVIPQNAERERRVERERRPPPPQAAPSRPQQSNPIPQSNSGSRSDSRGRGNPDDRWQNRPN